MKVRETSGKKCVQGFKYVIEFNPDRKQFLTENALIELHKKIGETLNIDDVSKCRCIEYEGTAEDGTCYYCRKELRTSY